MMDWTDRHCRYFHRLITHHTLLYTEMVNAGAIVHGGTERHLHYHPEEQPLALQLGGSDPLLLAQAATHALAYGYSEINLNCGCPSPRVQRGAFGACLMQESTLVAQCMLRIRDAVRNRIPISVKHRIGIDKEQNYAFVRDFIGTVAHASGCQVYIVHARNAWLNGLSPKENREIPPLRYEVVYQLKRDFPDLCIVLNGGVTNNAAIAQHLHHVDGVMLGRHAYHWPWEMRDWDTLFFGSDNPAKAQTTPQSPNNANTERAAVEDAMLHYMEYEQQNHNTPWPAIARHMLGLYQGLRGARHWRRIWSDHSLKTASPTQVCCLARQEMDGPG